MAILDDIRLQEYDWEYKGKIYKLSCNYNVLADLQAEYGQIPNIFESKDWMKMLASILAAMMSDYADSMGWPERFTGRQIGRTLNARKQEDLQPIIKLYASALYAPADEVPEQESKN